MFTYLTTYSSSVSIDTSSFYGLTASFSGTELRYYTDTTNVEAYFSNKNEASVYSSTNKSKGTQFVSLFLNSGYIEINDKTADSIDASYLSYSGYTQSLSPFSVYNGNNSSESGSTEYDATGSEYILGETIKQTFTVHNLGTVLTSTIDGYYSIF